MKTLTDSQIMQVSGGDEERVDRAIGTAIGSFWHGITSTDGPVSETLARSGFVGNLIAGAIHMGTKH